MPVIKPIVYNRADVIDKTELSVGDIIQYQKQGKNEPQFGIVADPLYMESGNSAQYAVHILPLEVVSPDKFVEQGERHYMLPRDFRTQPGVTSLNFRNNYMVKYALETVPLSFAHTGQSDDKVTRVGQMSRDETGTADRIFFHAFRTLGTRVLMTPYRTPVDVARMSTRTASDLMNKAAEGKRKEEIPSLGEQLFTADFLNPPETPKPKREKKERPVRVTIPSTVYSPDTPKKEYVDILSETPLNLAALMESRKIREVRLWNKIRKAVPGLDDLEEIGMLTDDELGTIRDVLLDENTSDRERLAFIRIIDSLNKQSTEIRPDELHKFYSMIAFDNTARDFQKEHPKAYGAIYRMLSEGKDLQEIIEHIHASDDNNLRTHATDAILSASYMYHFEKYDIARAPELVSALSSKTYTVSFDDAVKVGLLGERTAALLKTVEGLKTLSDANQLAATTPDALESLRRTTNILNMSISDLRRQLDNPDNIIDPKIHGRTKISKAQETGQLSKDAVARLSSMSAFFENSDGKDQIVALREEIMAASMQFEQDVANGEIYEEKYAGIQTAYDI